MHVSSDPTLHEYYLVCKLELCSSYVYNLIHKWIKKKEHKLEWLKNKIFKQGIGIAEKSLEQEGIAGVAM